MKSSGTYTRNGANVMPLKFPKLMQDSARPTSKLLKGFSAVAGYIGGDTPHVWTRDEWDRFHGVPKLPIWVNNVSPNTLEAGQHDAWNALQALFALKVPRGKAVAYDLETNEVPRRALGFQQVMTWAGFTTWVYGSAGYVFKNPAQNYWTADYTGKPHFTSRNSRATQYAAGVHVPGEPDIDESVIRYWQLKTGKLWT